MTAFNKLLERRGTLLLDGAIGTELERRGYKTRLPLWSASAVFEAPNLLRQIHSEYVFAGADIITANTFRTSSYTYAKTGQAELSQEATKRAVQIARESITSGSSVLVAGSIAPLEDCYSPELVPPVSQIEAVYAEQIALLADSGVDLIILETMINIDEAIIGAQHAHKSGLPYLISFTADEGRLLDGTALIHAVEQIQAFQPATVMLNCRRPDVITEHLQLISTIPLLTLGAYGNGSGRPGGDTGWLWDSTELSDPSYISEVERWLDIGARIVGGCCGTITCYGRCHAPIDRLESYS